MDNPNITIVWNDDKFAEKLKSIVSEENNLEILTSPEQFIEAQFKERSRNKSLNLVVLVELTWSNHHYSDFYGYEFVFNLIQSGFLFNISFISFLNQVKLKALLVGKLPEFQNFPIMFDHKQLPNVDFKKLNIPIISKNKWFLIKNYMLDVGAIIDKIEHDLGNLSTTVPIYKIVDTLNNIISISNYLPQNISSFATIIKQKLAVSDGDISKNIDTLKILLRKFKEEISPDAEKIENKKTHKVILVEDDDYQRNILEKNLKKYFFIESFQNGEEVLLKLKEESKSFSAIITDLELLNENGIMQPVWGIDIVEAAQKHPHLVIYILTSYSTRAISTHLRALNLNKPIPFIRKSTKNILPHYQTYEALAIEMKEKIMENRKYLAGPQNGLWPKCLLSRYFEIHGTEKGKEIWQNTFSNINDYINIDNNESEIISKQLIGINEKKSGYTDGDIQGLLTHRLLCLYYQCSDGCVNFTLQIKQKLGVRQSNIKHYFQTILGFNVVTEINLNKEKICYIQRINLFEEEKNWIRIKFPEDIIVDFDGLIDYLSTILNLLPNTIKIDFGFPNTICNLGDCIVALKNIYNLKKSGKNINKFIDLMKDYMNYYPEELEKLKENAEGKIIIAQIKKILH